MGIIFESDEKENEDLDCGIFLADIEIYGMWVFQRSERDKKLCQTSPRAVYLMRTTFK